MHSGTCTTLQVMLCNFTRLFDTLISTIRLRVRCILVYGNVVKSPCPSRYFNDDISPGVYSLTYPRIRITLSSVVLVGLMYGSAQGDQETLIPRKP